MYFNGLGTAVPARSFTQRECWDALQRADRPEITPKTRAILQGILTHDNGIERRSLALDDLDQGFQLDPDTLHGRFARHAPALAAEAARRALRDAHLGADDVDAVIISTCTGYLCPGLTSYVAEALIAARRADNVLCVCVEVCSAAFYLDDDLGVLVSACLFGDGAAAAIVSSRPQAARRVRWRSGESLHAPRHREALRFEQRGGMLRNILTLPVPKLAADHARAVLDAALAREEISRGELGGWVMHAGGRKVLDELKKRLALAAGDVRASAAILNEYGNLSSPFVLFVLKAMLDERAPGGLWWMSSFGAGFSCHGALLEVA